MKSLYLPIYVDQVSGLKTPAGPWALTQIAARQAAPKGTQIAVFELVEVLP